MKISIVTISYNQAKYLESAIRSVIEQKGVDLEYIIVDPGSNDGSREIIQSYSPYINKIVFEKDSGPADGLNKGFSFATGDIYGFINADDYLLPGSLKCVMKEFSKFAKVDVLSGHGYIVDQNDNILHSMFSFRLSGRKIDLVRFAYNRSCLVQPSTFFRKNIFIKVGGFRNNFKAIWDGALFLDFAVSGAKFKRVNQYWSCFRIHSKSLTGSGQGMPMNEFGNKYYNYLEKRVTRKKLSKVIVIMVWIIGWLSEPIHLYKRIKDKLKYIKRYL